MRWFAKSSVTHSRVSRPRSCQLAVESLEPRRVPTNASMFVAPLIVHSTESFMDFVINEYRNFLGRAPDLQGLNGWVQALTNGMSPEAVEAAFVSSSEYIFDHGNTAASFLFGLYHDLLGRAPDSAGFNNWLNMMAQGLTPAQVATFFATSVERQSIVVTEDYLLFLGRTPEGGAVTFWVNQLGHGLNRADVESMIVGSTEFFLKQGDTNVGFITGAYQDVLGRTPGTDEINFWLNGMAQHP
jgi:hypothetical protein